MTNVNYFKTEVSNQVARITLSHPPFNGMNPDFMEALSANLDELKAASASTRPRVLVLQSEVENQFCSGMDPSYFVNADLDERKRIFLGLGEMIESFYKFGIPIISVVSGPALAGGAVLALLGDVILMDATKGNICFSEVKVGLPLPKFIQDLIAFKVGQSNLFQVGLLAKNVGPELALSMQLADALYQNEQESQKLVIENCEKFMRLPAAVVSQSLWELKEPLLESKVDFLNSFDDSFAPFLTDQFLGKGLKALLKGERPDWS